MRYRRGIVAFVVMKIKKNGEKWTVWMMRLKIRAVLCCTMDGVKVMCDVIRDWTKRSGRRPTFPTNTKTRDKRCRIGSRLWLIAAGRLVTCSFIDPFPFDPLGATICTGKQLHALLLTRHSSIYTGAH